MLFNGIIITFIIAFLCILVFVLFKGYLGNTKESNKKEIFELNTLTENIRLAFSEILRMDVTSLNLNKHAVMQVLRNKKSTRLAYKNCSLGDLSSKNYIKEYIKNMLEKRFFISEKTIDKVIPFHDSMLLTEQDRGEILLLHYKRKHAFDAFKEMVIKNDLIKDDSEKGYIVDKESIRKAYDKVIGKTPLSYPDKLEIVAQRIYQRIKGNGVVDEIRDMRIDGVSGGVNGMPVGFFDYDLSDMNKAHNVTYSFESVYVMFKGRSVHLEYLSFGSQQELERVCKNVYRYDNPGQLSKSKPYIINKMADGSRVVVVIPDLSDSWQFFIRKFDTASAEKIETLITDKGATYLIQLIRFLMLGEQSTMITGMQGTGKSTILKSFVGFIRRCYNIGVEEVAFELWLRKTFNFANVATLCETTNVTGQEGLNVMKKMDRDVIILGEIASAETFDWAIQTSGVASRFTLCTQHAKTTPILIKAGTSALLQHGGFSNELFAQDRVVQAFRFDVHLEKNPSGHRYVERVTEIVPGKNMGEYDCVNIIEWINGEYHLVHPISEPTMKEMINFMLPEEATQFQSFFREEDIVA